MIIIVIFNKIKFLMSGTIEERMSHLLNELKSGWKRDINSTITLGKKSNDDISMQRSGTDYKFNDITRKNGFLNFSVNSFKTLKKNYTSKNKFNSIDFDSCNCNLSREFSPINSESLLNTQSTTLQGSVAPQTTSSLTVETSLIQNNPCTGVSNKKCKTPFELYMSRKKIQREISYLTRDYLNKTNFTKNFITKPKVILDSPNLLVSQTRKEYFALSPTHLKQKSLATPDILKIFKTSKKKNNASSHRWVISFGSDVKHTEDDSFESFTNGFEHKTILKCFNNFCCEKKPQQNRKAMNARYNSFLISRKIEKK